MDPSLSVLSRTHKYDLNEVESRFPHTLLLSFFLNLLFFLVVLAVPHTAQSNGLRLFTRTLRREGSVQDRKRPVRCIRHLTRRDSSSAASQLALILRECLCHSVEYSSGKLYKIGSDR